MTRISSRKFLITAIIIMLSAGTISSAVPLTNLSPANEAILPVPQKKRAGIKKPVSAEKAQKRAEAKDQKRRKDSEKYLEWNRKRSVEIQTPEVQERMKQNVKDANAQSKARKKHNSARSKKAGRKYR